MIKALEPGTVDVLALTDPVVLEEVKVESRSSRVKHDAYHRNVHNRVTCAAEMLGAVRHC